jgi:hypothetical protein
MAKWVNGSGAKTTRHATSWVIQRFVDPDAEILYGATNEEREALVKSHSARLLYYHPHPHDTLGTIVADLGLEDPALPLFMAIVRTAAHGNGYIREQEGPGLGAIVKGVIAAGGDDEANLAALTPVFDALYTYCQAEVAKGRSPVARFLTDPEKESLAPAKQVISIAAYQPAIAAPAGQAR